MKLKKFLALALALVMAFSLTGCLGNAYSRVMTVEGEEISPGLYLMLQLRAYSEAEGLYETEYAEANGGETPTNYDILRQRVEGVGASRWIQQRTEEMARRYVAVQNLAREHGVMLSEESWSNIESSETYWDYLEDYYLENGIGRDNWLYYMENGYLDDELFLALYGEDGPMTPNREEMAARYAEERVHVRYLSLPVLYSSAGEEDEPDEDEVRAGVVALAEQMVARLEGGASMQDLLEDEYQQVYDLTGRTYDASVGESYIYTGYLNPESTYYGEWFTENVMSLSVGDVAFSEGESSVIVFELLPMLQTDEEFAEQYDTILNTVYRDDYDEYLAGIYNEYSVSKAFLATWYYRPSKIV